MNNSSVVVSINNDIFNITFQNINFEKTDYILLIDKLKNMIETYKKNNKKFYFLINTTQINMLKIKNIYSYIIKFSVFFKNNEILIKDTIKYAYILSKKKSILLTIIGKLYYTIIPYKIIVIKHTLDNNYINNIINKHIISLKCKSNTKLNNTVNIESDEKLNKESNIESEELLNIESNKELDETLNKELNKELNETLNKELNTELDKQLINDNISKLVSN
tara:strand:- start:4121 stop:4783 length:663 start_codon:yes stop_codon:yes gene_type:complete